MTSIAGRVLGRIRRLLRPSAEAYQALLKQQQLVHKQLAARLDRLDERLTSALDQGRADMHLIAGRMGRPASRSYRGGPIPRTHSDLRSSEAPDVSGAAPAGISTLTACPGCGHAERTVVAEFNRFLLLDSAPDSHSARYDYALCHGCGIVFATRRPVGARFHDLVARFEESLGRTRKDDDRPHVLGSRALSSDDVSHLRSLLAAGVFLSEGVPGRRSGSKGVPALLRDRLAVSPHVEILGSLLQLHAPRVLELRPRFGAIGGALRRLYGGETFALPLFEAQRLIAREVYGTTADALLDYDRFSIPYDGLFDLIVANHSLTHAVRPAELLATVRDRLTPGGHLYLYNEPDEADFLESGKSMFKTLNPFHLQTFDADSLGRVLRTAGFDPVFMTHHQGNCVALARVSVEPPACTPLSLKLRRRRLDRYARARDWAILLLPDHVKGLFADEWDAVIERAFASGVVEFDKAGRLRLVGYGAGDQTRGR